MTKFWVIDGSSGRPFVNLSHRVVNSGHRVVNLGHLERANSQFFEILEKVETKIKQLKISFCSYLNLLFVFCTFYKIYRVYVLNLKY